MYIRQLSDADLAEAVKPYLEDALSKRIDDGILRRIVPLVKERIRLLTEIVEMADFFFVEGPLDYDAEMLARQEVRRPSARCRRRARPGHRGRRRHP